MRHFLWIGDSLTRYQYLDFVYRLHFDEEKSPKYVIGESYWGGWTVCCGPDKHVMYERGNGTRPRAHQRVCVWGEGGALTICQRVGDLREN